VRITNDFLKLFYTKITLKVYACDDMTKKLNPMLYLQARGA
jgi:hypothetical protein